MNFEKRFTRESILELLHSIDNSLVTKTEIVLCGGSCILLQGYTFRETSDIDFVTIPDVAVVFAAARLLKKRKLSYEILDYNSAGVVQLLEDYELRLVEIPDGFRYLSVKVLSLKDWAVSKLCTKKLSDTINYGLVSLADVEEIKFLMRRYMGMNGHIAFDDLRTIELYLKDGAKMGIGFTDKF